MLRAIGNGRCPQTIPTDTVQFQPHSQSNLCFFLILISILGDGPHVTPNKTIN